MGRVQTGNRENSNYKFQIFFLEKCDRLTDIKIMSGWYYLEIRHLNLHDTGVGDMKFPTIGCK